MATESHSIELHSQRHTCALSSWLAPRLLPGDVLLLEGDLGAGKSFFASALVHALGVAESIPVTSPTFSLMNEYHARLPIVHADAYRLADPEELEELGLFEKLAEGAVAIIEWGNLLRPILQEPFLVIALEILEADRRKATLTAHGQRPVQLLEALKRVVLET